MRFHNDLLIPSGQNQNVCLQTNNEYGLPTFQGYGYHSGQPGAPARRIHHQHQAIISSYKFNCCGNITEWGVDLNPLSYSRNVITFDFDFQVWRPSPTINETGCYSLVDNLKVMSISIPSQLAPSEHVARVTPLPQYQLHFQPGDVLGFYVESHGEGSHPGGDDNNGVVLLNSADYTSELVWYGHASARRWSGSCPYPVGTSGVLSLSTHAAPVISIKITTTSCPLNPATESSVISISITTSSCSPTTTYLPLSSPSTCTTTAVSTSSVTYLVLGASVSVIALVVLIIFTAVIAAVIIGRHRKQSNPTSAATMEQVSDSDLYVYDSPAMNTITAYSIQLKSNVAYAAHSKAL